MVWVDLIHTIILLHENIYLVILFNNKNKQIIYHKGT